VVSKVCPSAAEAVAGIEDGVTIMIGGCGRAGQPVELIDALLVQGAPQDGRFVPLADRS
jgi:3-oxoadipate CoA-transferase, alpha subunit